LRLCTYAVALSVCQFIALRKLHLRAWQCGLRLPGKLNFKKGLLRQPRNEFKSQPKSRAAKCALHSNSGAHIVEANGRAVYPMEWYFRRHRWPPSLINGLPKGLHYLAARLRCLATRLRCLAKQWPTCFESLWKRESPKKNGAFSVQKKNAARENIRDSLL